MTFYIIVIKISDVQNIFIRVFHYLYLGNDHFKDFIKKNKDLIYHEDFLKYRFLHEYIKVYIEVFGENMFSQLFRKKMFLNKVSW